MNKIFKNIHTQVVLEKRPLKEWFISNFFESAFFSGDTWGSAKSSKREPVAGKEAV